jgi:ribulose-5-phosphate 4-epimerase/fuculose-1-phosphate aldolase
VHILEMLELKQNLADAIRMLEHAPNEYHIHTEIHRRRADVHSVVHAHPKWSTFFSMTGTTLDSVIIQGALLGDIQTFPQVGSINTKLLGEQLAETLGHHRSVLMKSHGAVVASEGILQTFVLAVYLEENAYRAYMAASLGQPYVLNEDEKAAAVKNLWKTNLLQKVWNYQFSKFIKG